VFFSDADCQTYLALLRECMNKSEVAVLAYCLMPNHVHLVVIPPDRTALADSLRRVHTRYAQRVNRQRDWKGHLWQGRYFASVLDERHCWAAIRYVECNPVRAGMVKRAEDHPWSSARAHCGWHWDPVLTVDHHWRQRIEGIPAWSAWLAEGDDKQHLRSLRKNASKGMPCGSDEFINQLESSTGRRLRDGRIAKGVRPL